MGMVLGEVEEEVEVEVGRDNHNLTTTTTTTSLLTMMHFICIALEVLSPLR